MSGLRVDRRPSNSPYGSTVRPSTSHCGLAFRHSIRCPRCAEGYDGVRPAPDRQRPYHSADEPPATRPGNTTSNSTWCTNPGYHGNRIPQNKGLRFVFYANLETAYADLLSSNLDVLDTIPSSVLAVYRRGPRRPRDHRACSGKPDPGHSAAAAALRRRRGPAAPPRTVGRDQSTADLPKDLLPARARRPAISPPVRCPVITPTSTATTHSTSTRTGRGGCGRRPTPSRNGPARYAIAYNADGGHTRSGWTRSPTASKTLLGIDAIGAPQPTFATFRTQITTRKIATAFRAGWQGDFPSMLEFLEPLFVTGAGADDVGYSDPAIRRRDRRGRGRARACRSRLPRQRRTANPVAGHARRAVVVHRTRRRTDIGVGQPRRADLEWTARLRAHRKGLRWVGTSLDESQS